MNAIKNREDVAHVALVFLLTRVMLYALREEITRKCNIFQIKISTRFSSSTSREDLRAPRVKGINVKRRDGNLISFCPNFILSPFPLPLSLFVVLSPFRTMAMYFNSLLRKEFQPARAVTRGNASVSLGV